MKEPALGFVECFVFRRRGFLRGRQPAIFRIAENGVEIRAVRFASRRKIIVLIEKRKTRLELKYYKYYIFVVVIFHKNISQFLNETLNEKKRQSLRRTELSALMDRASDRNMIYPDRP